MFFSTPFVMHSRTQEGRHWLTILDFPPLQIWPVAPNHCRVGTFLATLVSAKLAELGNDPPAELILSRADVAAVPSLADRYPEFADGAGEVRVRLAAMPGPMDVAPEDDEDEEPDDEPAKYVTPQPPLEWPSSYDEWITAIAKSLGVNAPEPGPAAGYESAMAAAVSQVQLRLPALRDRFLAGMDGLNLGLKIAISTNSGGKEYVWARPTIWSDEQVIECVLESQPRDCKGYKAGQSLRVAVSDVQDYAIGSETAGLVDPGLTQIIAEDYGLILS